MPRFMWPCGPDTFMQTDKRRPEANDRIAAQGRPRTQLLYLDDKEWDDIMRSIHDICTETYMSDIFTGEIIRSELRLLIYRICRVIDHYTDISEMTPKLIPHDRHERYFERFMQVVSRHYMQERSVRVLCRQVEPHAQISDDRSSARPAGRTATDWINSFRHTRGRRTC